MRLIITSDKHQFIVSKVRKVKGEEVLDPLGYYATVEGLAKGVARHSLRAPRKGWSPEQLTEALASFRAETVKLENRCTKPS